ncbi:YggT family protein [Allocatelliglobosispora scoriae]|uniref:YggT family protein n=1 Tax=Allocatelliglobosispora scoriae TaxID=643052 RepID=A0A841BRJ0_9ACTN|nr:YggT family protein [Allocatelliglobosispora scoriae]MBB5869362.1 YggT family protein [Allocatelliglobosispora scoriae]
MLSIVWQVVYLVLYMFWVILIARFLMSFILQRSRHWRPGRNGAAGLEVVWSVTDPALKPLRRVIPPLRLGNVSVALADLILLIILYVLMQIVRGLI